MRAGAEAARAGEAGRLFNSGRGERDKGGVFQVVQAGERGGGSSRWLEAGGDVHARDENGLTPLHYAAQESEISEIVEILLKAGARIDARNENGWMPLHWAVSQSETPAVANVLLEAGADANARDGSNKTPFDYAKGNSAIKGTDVYWRLNEARFERDD